MNTKTKEVYYCEHCKKHGLSKHAMVKHEKFCMKDPKNIHACFNCKNIGSSTRDTADNCKGSTYFFCRVQKNKQIHNITAVRKGLLEKHPDDFEGSELMPTTCSLFIQGFPDELL